MNPMLAKKAFTEALKKHGKINISQLSKELEIPRSTLSHHIRTDRRWRVEDWLGTLAKLGAVEISKDGIYIKSKILSKNLRKIIS